MHLRAQYSAHPTTRHVIAAALQGNAMNESKTWILGVAAGLVMTMALIAALNSYVTRIQTTAARPVVQLEPVTVSGERVQDPTTTLADTHAKQPASL
jgi:hypothetical protein